MYMQIIIKLSLCMHSLKEFSTLMIYNNVNTYSWSSISLSSPVPFTSICPLRSFGSCGSRGSSCSLQTWVSLFSMLTWTAFVPWVTLEVVNMRSY